MKKTINIIIMLEIVIVSALGLIIFFKKNDSVNISLNTTSLSMLVGEEKSLLITINSNEKELSFTWSSSNTNVAIVESNGLVTAISEGSAVITVQSVDGNYTATCTIYVKGSAINPTTIPSIKPSNSTNAPQSISVIGVTLNKKSLNVTVGETETLKKTISPSNASNQNVTWTSSNTSIATVDSNGIVKAIREGTTVIKVTTLDGRKEATCNVVVTKRTNSNIAKISSGLNSNLNRNINFNINGNTLLFGSDYQSTYRSSHFTKVITKVNQSPSLTLFLGDYTNEYSDATEISNIVHQRFANSGVLFTQGNHDDDMSFITKTGGYEATNYLIYVINYDDNPKSKSSSKFVPKCAVHSSSANLLDKFLQSVSSLNIKKPVFVLSHLPLHSSSRGDNLCSSYFAEVLNKYGDKLDILYIFGHNHSNNYDDCLGGAINYYSKGSTLNIACHSGSDAPSSVSCSNKKYSSKIKFTYLNAGYVGYSKSTDGMVSCSGLQVSSTSELSMSFFTINSSNILYQRYGYNGLISSKTINRIN